MIGLLTRAAALRRRFMADLADARNSFTPLVSASQRWIIAVAWSVERKRRVLLAVANIDFQKPRQAVVDVAEDVKGVKVSTDGPNGPSCGTCETLLEIKRSRTRPRVTRGRLRVAMEPGDVKVIVV